MSTVRVESPTPEPAHHYLVRRTVEACRLAKEAAGAAAEGIATGSSVLLNSLRQRERELDKLDMEIDDGVTTAITEVGPAEARELLACMKFMIGLERIGDLLRRYVPPSTLPTPMTNGDEELAGPEEDVQRSSAPRAPDSRVSQGGER